MENETPADVFRQINEDSEPNLPARQTVTKSSATVGEGVKTVEDRVRNWQIFINDWRISIIQKEDPIIIFCIILGGFYSWAVNECTGNFNVPFYAYVMSAIIIGFGALLLITEGSLPLVVLVKFAVAIALGHTGMMWAIAVDGHSFHFFTIEVCRYPLTTESFMVYLLGGGSGYIVAKFEEIRAGSKP